MNCKAFTLFIIGSTFISMETMELSSKGKCRGTTGGGASLPQGCKICDTNDLKGYFICVNGTQWTSNKCNGTESICNWSGPCEIRCT